ncbi:hypothetical protein ABZ934_06120 [Streptomyces sp. NPDC046557]|uniref:hypothetical protein n=1 Tax=Streptomyces sp. NPDC046557 TaxID=3155372 RepID=UPI0033E51F24
MAPSPGDRTRRAHGRSDRRGTAGAPRFLDAAFDGDFADEGFEHALGGLHVPVREDGGLLAHGSVVQRRVAQRGRRPHPGPIGVLGPAGDPSGSPRTRAPPVWTPPGGIRLDPAGRLDFDWRNGDVL